MSSYHTRQKKAVEEFFFNNHDRGFTPDEVASSLPSVPRSTVYRLITQLSDEGFLRKHMHIRCRLCGRTEHLSAEATASIEDLIEKTSGFVALDSTVFDGLCSQCRGRK